MQICVVLNYLHILCFNENNVSNDNAFFYSRDVFLFLIDIQHHVRQWQN